VLCVVLQAFVDRLVQGWRARALAFAWTYRRNYVYKLGGPVAEPVGSLHAVLEEFACAAETVDNGGGNGEDVDGGDADTSCAVPCAELVPAALRLATDAVHDAALADGLALSIRMAVVVFVNATVTITAAGLELHTRTDVPCAPRLLLHDGFAVSARAYVPVALPHGGVDAVGFDAGLLAGELLPLAANMFPLLGALLRPAWLRGADLRPVFVLATSPPDVTHAVVWAMHTFGGFAVTRTLTGADTDTSVPADDEPYILFIDAKLRELTREDTSVIARALARRMAVVVAADTVPEVLYAAECEYLRLALCHVRVSMPLCAIKHQVACEQLLFACTTAYATQRRAAALSFIAAKSELMYRLDYSAHRRLVPTMLMEMFQSGLGLQLAAGKTCSIRAVHAMLTLYHERRCPDDMMRPECSVEDVLAAAAAFRQYFGSHFGFEPLVYDNAKGVFLNLQDTRMHE
jgi:hypothetical protein